MRVLRSNLSGDDVKSWQTFLRGLNPSSSLIVTGTFDPPTYSATVAFQRATGLQADGVVGTRTLGKAMSLGFNCLEDVSTDKSSSCWPPQPLEPSLSPSEREKMFGSFAYVPVPVAGNPEAIKITDGWSMKNIVGVQTPTLNHLNVNAVQFNKLAADQFLNLLRAWDDAGMSRLILSWGGTWSPRFIRGSRTVLSNHAWGTAFDINVQWNMLGAEPALVGSVGSVRELVDIASANGFYWGGWFGYKKGGRADGMHFEICKLLLTLETQMAGRIKSKNKEWYHESNYSREPSSARVGMMTNGEEADGDEELQESITLSVNELRQIIKEEVSSNFVSGLKAATVDQISSKWPKFVEYLKGKFGEMLGKAKFAVKGSGMLSKGTPFVLLPDSSRTVIFWDNVGPKYNTSDTVAQAIGKLSALSDEAVLASCEVLYFYTTLRLILRMTANRVIDEHSELSGVGSLTHDQLDAYVNTSPYVIVSGAVGSVPPGARKLVAGPGVTITDGGAGGDLIVSVTSVTTGSTVQWMERPSGLADGSNMTFNLTRAPVPGTALMFYVNGLLQEQGSDSDYTLSGSVISMLYPYRSGSNIRATYPY